MAELPLDARIRELWKAVVITASEHDNSDVAIAKADAAALAFIQRFYPNDMIAGQTRVKIMNARGE